MYTFSLQRPAATLLVAASLIAGAALAANSTDSKAALDGKSFQGTFVRAGEKDGDADTFIFKNGQFISTACQDKGFDPAGYTAKPDGKVVRFEAESHAGDALMRWSGTVDGDQFNATAK